MRIAAWAIRHGLVTSENAAGKVKALDYLLDVPDMERQAAQRILAAAGVRAEDLVRRLGPNKRDGLAREIERAISS